MSKSLLRLAFSLCLLAVVLVLGVPRPANACPRAVTIKYYGWVEANNPGFYHWCTNPGGSIPIPPGYFVWQQIGQESTDCDGNYSTWGDITTCTDGSNVVRTSTACTCAS
jgi:hypothetical protein